MPMPVVVRTGDEQRGWPEELIRGGDRPIVAGIVQQHGGTITAANAASGGASFTFTLARRPSVAREPADGPPPPARVNAGAPD